MSVLLAGILMTVCGSNSDETTAEGHNLDAHSSCFWGGPYGKQNPASNFAFPDTCAAYWHAKYTQPAVVSLKITGQFTHAHHMSFNSQDSVTATAFTSTDKSIVPDT